MKSPNVKSTSDRRASSSSEVSKLSKRSLALLLAVCPILLCSCQSSDSYKSDSAKNPYAQYEPKTPEEEAYYHDVYSGDWREQTDPTGMQKSICKKTGSTTMPPHWATLPRGAKTLEEIRAEASRKRTAQALAAPYPPASTTQPSYAAASTPAPVQQTYAAQTYAEPQVAAQNAYAAPVQQTYSAPVETAAAPQASYAPSAVQPTYAQQVEAAPVQSAYPTQAAPAQTAYPTQAAPAQAAPTQSAYPTQAAPVQSAYPTQAAPTQAAPVQSAYPTQAAPVQSEYPTQAAPAQAAPQYTPSNYNSASVERVSVDSLGERTWILRGQDPAVNEKAATEQESAPVEVKGENVKAKVAEKAVVALDESRAGGVQVKPNIVDPSIAAPYANVRRPEANPSAPADASAPRANQGEYVVSGGDSKEKVVANKDWLVENLDGEDAAAHFDTVDGRILTEPTNRVFLYSPRFGVVRQVLAPVEGAQRTAVDAATTAQGAIADANVASVDVRSQDEKLLSATGTQDVAGAESAMAPTTGIARVGVLGIDGQLKLKELLTSNTVDSLGTDESALMMDGAVAAQSWSDKAGVAIAVDQANVHSNVYLDGPATVYAIDNGTVTSKLRVIKIANKDTARPGEFVEFTLRFENVGDQPLGNVTILDNLSARLRYVDGTAKSSVKADFLADLSETGSLVLRWEITEPLQPKEFGVVRFICKVQ